MRIEIELLKDDVLIPEYATEGSSGFDLVVHNFKDYYPTGNIPINPNEREGKAIRGGDGQWYVPPHKDIPKYLHGNQITCEKFKYIQPVGSLVMYPGSRLLVGCGYKVAVPEGYELQVRPRSGKALKEGLACANGVGTVDSDYRGEMGVILINHGKDAVTVSVGDKVAQGIIQKVEKAEWERVGTLHSTARGEGGFGSTGDRAGDAAKKYFSIPGFSKEDNGKQSY